MVLKELYRVDEQAQKNFLKEVRTNSMKLANAGGNLLEKIIS